MNCQSSRMKVLANWRVFLSLTGNNSCIHKLYHRSFRIASQHLSSRHNRAAVIPFVALYRVIAEKITCRGTIIKNQISQKSDFSKVWFLKSLISEKCDFSEIWFLKNLILPNSYDIFEEFLLNCNSDFCKNQTFEKSVF